MNPDAPSTDYGQFQLLSKILPDKFRPSGFELVNYYSGNAVYFGFDPELAWGKRTKTTVDGDDSKPSQIEYIFVDKTTKSIVILEVMYTSTRLDRDVVGFVRVPEQTAKLSDGTSIEIKPPQTFTQIFSYGHFVVVLQSFGTDPTEPLAAVQANKSLSLELRGFLDKEFKYAN